MTPQPQVTPPTQMVHHGATTVVVSQSKILDDARKDLGNHQKTQSELKGMLEEIRLKME